jgi:hypothetical protein
MTGIMKSVLVGLLLSVLFSATTRAATFTAATCNESDVNALINGPTHTAVTGDTIIIPNGSCTWSSQLNVPVGITLKGASVGGVTITDTNPNGPDSPSCGNFTLICMNLDSNYHTTLANLKFVTGSGVGSGNYVVFYGTGQVGLMHDMDFNIPNAVLSHAVQWLTTGGVIWNTAFESTSNLGAGCTPPNGPGSQSGSIVVKSNKNWDDASTMGTLDTGGVNNLYIEDSTFTYVGQIPDVDENARVVLRHDTWLNTTGGVGHGPTSSYGTRQVEIYDNTFNLTNNNVPVNRYFWFRGGTVLITGNNITALNTAPCNANSSSFQFIVESATRSTSHGCCTGYMCFHQPGSGSDGTSGHSALSRSQTPYDSYQQPDPVYIWNNTGTGQSSVAKAVSLNDSDMSCNNRGDNTAAFFQLNRDYFVDISSNPTIGARPGWTRYSYPHPLRQGQGLPNAPSNLHATPQ